MLEPRFLAELAMVVVVAASLIEPPAPWVLAPPLVVIIAPAAGRGAALAIAAALACIVLAVWSIFSRDSQEGIFVAFAIFATAAIPDHMSCIMPETTRRLCS